MRLFGLIGFPLTHSFSPAFFNDMFQRENIPATYQAYPLASLQAFPGLLKTHSFSGLNVTIPYKEQILPYLHLLDNNAAEIGAVNTIHFADGKLIGYNTDAPAFRESLLQFISPRTQVRGALVLGTGGAAKAVTYVLKKEQIPYLQVSSTGKGDLAYTDIDSAVLKDHNLIINTTPLGTFPDTTACPSIPYELLNENYFLYDLIYNPEKTLFLTEGLNKGARIKNGWDMLLLQAKLAWEIWNQPVM